MTYSRCVDTIDNYTMVCGGYAISGFGVDSFSYSFNSQLCGVVAYVNIDDVKRITRNCLRVSIMLNLYNVVRVLFY